MAEDDILVSYNGIETQKIMGKYNKKRQSHF
jgi:hypothetical protein